MRRGWATRRRVASPRFWLHSGGRRLAAGRGAPRGWHRGASLSPTSTGRFQWFLPPSITGTSAFRPPLPIPQRHHRYASHCCATLIQISLFEVWREWQTDFG